MGTEGGDSATDDDSSAPLVGCRRYMDGHIWMTGEYLFKSDVYSWAVIFYEMISEIPPYQGLSSLEHQQLVCAQGQRPSLNTCYVPPVVDTILTEAWDPKISKRINSTQVCDKMQRFLLELDSCYYEQNEEDFLLDIEVKEETVSNFADDKWFEGSEDDNETRFGNSSMRTLDLIHDDSSSAYTGGTGAHDSSAELKISKSKLSDASSYTTFASSVKATKPKRVVSSAA